MPHYVDEPVYSLSLLVGGAFEVMNWCNFIEKINLIHNDRVTFLENLCFSNRITVNIPMRSIYVVIRSFD